VIGRRPERSGRRRTSLGRFLVRTLLPDATIPSPHADDQHRRKRQEAGETEPALCRCTSAMTALIGSVKKQPTPDANGTPS